jgi:type VI protein secretion system component VasK
LQISNVRNFKQFTKIKNYLSNLSAIRNVEVHKILNDKIRLKLGLLGDINSLKEALSLTTQLSEEKMPLNDVFNPVSKNKSKDMPTDLLLKDSTMNAQQSVASQIGAMDTHELKDGKQNADQRAPVLFYRWIE